MTQPAPVTTPRGGVLWKRAAGLFVVCMVAVGVLAFALIVGVIPVSFGVSKNPFDIQLAKLEGTKITAYVGTDPAVNDGDTPVAIAGVEGGTGRNLCLTTTLDLPLIGDVSIRITSGESKDIPLQELSAMATAMDIGDVTAKNIQLGLDGSTLNANDIIVGPDGSWGLQMGTADVEKITLKGEQIEVASLRLRGLGLGVELDDHIAC